jgi:TonB family protein
MLQLALIGAALSVTAPEASKELVQAPPAGRWVVEFAQSACQATQPVTMAGKPGAVALLPRPTTEYTNLLVLVPREIGGLGSAEVLIGGHRIEAKGMEPKAAPRTGQRVYEVQLTRSEHAMLLATGDLRVRTRGTTVRFAPTGLPQVQRTLDGCVANLLEGWGMSKAAQAELASFPEPEIETSGYVRAEDYPSSALDARAGGDVQVRLTIGTDGRPKGCAVQQSAGHSALDATTCAIFVRRARFKPARTKQGRAVEAPYIATIKWRVY